MIAIVQYSFYVDLIIFITICGILVRTGTIVIELREIKKILKNQNKKEN